MSMHTVHRCVDTRRHHGFHKRCFLNLMYLFCVSVCSCVHGQRLVRRMPCYVLLGLSAYPHACDQAFLIVELSLQAPTPPLSEIDFLIGSLSQAEAGASFSLYSVCLR